MVNNQKDFQKRVKNVEKSLRKALERNRLKLTTTIDFPKYRRLPTSLQLVLTLLEEEGGIIVRQYNPLKETKEKEKSKKEKNGKK